MQTPVITGENVRRLVRTRIVDMPGPPEAPEYAVVFQFKGIERGWIALSTTSGSSWAAIGRGAGAEIEYLFFPNTSFGGVALSPDQRWFAYGSICSRAWLVDLIKGQTTHYWEHIWLIPDSPYKDRMTTIAFNDTSTMLLTCGAGNYMINVLYQAPEWAPQALWPRFGVEEVIAFTETELICLGMRLDETRAAIGHAVVRVYDLSAQEIAVDIVLGGEEIKNMQASRLQDGVCYVRLQREGFRETELYRVDIQQQTVTLLGMAPYSHFWSTLMLSASGDILLYLAKEGLIVWDLATNSYSVTLPPEEFILTPTTTKYPDALRLALDTTGRLLMVSSATPPVVGIWQVAE